MKAAVGDHIADEINDNIWHWALCRMGGDVSAFKSRPAAGTERVFHAV